MFLRMLGKKHHNADEILMWLLKKKKTLLLHFDIKKGGFAMKLINLLVTPSLP